MLLGYNYTMDIKNIINKCSFLLKRNKFNYLLLIILTIVYYLYLNQIVIPYGRIHDILIDENTLPAQAHMPEYIMLSYPTYMTYILVSFWIGIKIYFIRFLIYPILLNLYFWGSMYCIMSHGVEYIWLYIVTYPVLLSIAIIFAIIGLIQDIKTFKNTTVPNDYNIYQNISSTVSIWKSRVSKVFCFFKSICQRIWNYFTEDIKK